MGELIALFIPILALLIPIIAIWFNHQQKMAALIGQQQRGGQSDQEIAALRAEVRELKEMVHAQVLAMDSYASRSRVADEDIRDRVGNAVR